MCISHCQELVSLILIAVAFFVSQTRQLQDLQASPHFPELFYLSILATRRGYDNVERGDELDILRVDFLREASQYFPFLRFIALGTTKGSVSLDPKEDYAEALDVWQWWEIVRDPAVPFGGEVVEIREIPEWEGRRVGAFIRDVEDAETFKVFDGTSTSTYLNEREACRANALRGSSRPF